MNERKCPNCGNTHFYAHQLLRMDVIVDTDGEFEESIQESGNMAIYDAEKPYGPFVCTRCGAEFDKIEDINGPFVKREKIFNLLDINYGHTCDSIIIKNTTEQT